MAEASVLDTNSDVFGQPGVLDDHFASPDSFRSVWIGDCRRFFDLDFRSLIHGCQHDRKNSCRLY